MDPKASVLPITPQRLTKRVALTSDHVVNAGDELMCHIVFLFTSFVVHGSVPGGFLSSTIIP